MIGPLRIKLQHQLKNILTHLELRPEPYCEQRLEAVIEHGLEVMQLNRATENPSSVILAEQNLRHLLEYLTEYAKDHKTFPTMTQQCFDSAITECNRMWPYV